MFYRKRIEALEQRIVDQGNYIQELTTWINALSFKLKLFRDVSDEIPAKIIYVDKKQYKLHHPDVEFTPRVTVTFHDGSIYQTLIKNEDQLKNRSKK